jgi:oligopeptidase B
MALLDRGILYVIAHIRGGGEIGEVCRDQGRMMLKRNTFTDFIACAEHLIGEKYTSADRLAISGRSAGGMLIGAVVNMRPELFRAALAYLPFVDVLNTITGHNSMNATMALFVAWLCTLPTSPWSSSAKLCAAAAQSSKAFPRSLPPWR